ncbi:MAG: hypothetical protein QM800_02765 [Paludibacter sp.]
MKTINIGKITSGICMLIAMALVSVTLFTSCHKEMEGQEYRVYADKNDK